MMLSVEVISTVQLQLKSKASSFRMSLWSEGLVGVAGPEGVSDVKWREKFKMSQAAVCGSMLLHS